MLSHKQAVLTVSWATLLRQVEEVHTERRLTSVRMKTSDAQAWAFKSLWYVVGLWNVSYEIWYI